MFDQDFVVPDTLATLDQFTTWAAARGATVPSNAQSLLYAVTPLVLEASQGVIYDVDTETGLATDSTVAQALADATCVQALAWSKLGIDPDMGGVVTAGVKTAKGIGTARISYGDTVQAAQARADAITSLVPAAARILQQHGLLGTEPWVIG